MRWRPRSRCEYRAVGGALDRHHHREARRPRCVATDGMRWAAMGSPARALSARGRAARRPFTAVTAERPGCRRRLGGLRRSDSSRSGTSADRRSASLREPDGSLPSSGSTSR